MATASLSEVIDERTTNDQAADQDTSHATLIAHPARANLPARTSAMDVAEPSDSDGSTPAMRKAWSKPAEQLVFSALENNVRIIGIASPDRSENVGSFAALMAETFSASGSKSLLLDLSKKVADTAGGPSWIPGEGGVGQSIRQDDRGFDLLRATPTPQTRLLLSNAERFRKTFEEELRHYNSIIVEMPALSDGDAQYINPVGPALACDSVLVFCATDKTNRQTLVETLNPMKAAGVKLSGMIQDTSQTPSLAEEISREARWLRFISPRLASWLERKIKAIGLLQ